MKKMTKAQERKAIQQLENDMRIIAHQQRIEHAEDQAKSRREQLRAERTYGGLTQDSYGPGPIVNTEDYTS
jgi:hypothetical protein